MGERGSGERREPKRDLERLEAKPDPERCLVPAGEGLTRREVLRLGAGAAALAALELSGAAGDAAGEPGAARSPRRESSFDEGWLFLRGEESGAEAPSFDDRAWRELDVPHDWSIEDLPGAAAEGGALTADPSAFAYLTDPGSVTGAPPAIGPFDKQMSAGGAPTGYTVGGVGWYRKRFRVPDPGGRAADRRVELRFGGVFQSADFWLNGQHLGFHPNGYVSFAFDLTPHLVPGENVLAVRVDNGGNTSRWYSGSGIYRHTWLTVTGPVRIPLWGVRVATPVVDERASIARVEVEVANAGAALEASVRVTVLDADGRASAEETAPAKTVDASGPQTFAVELALAGAALWSPDAPSLYRARTEVLVRGEVVDSLTTPFGVRAVAASDAGFFLNGKPLKLRGGCVHHDHGPLGAVSLYRSEERRVQTLKALGFNAIRTAHNPPSSELLEACDRLGMLVYDELTDVFRNQKFSPQDDHRYFAEWWERDLTSMVRRDRNHPSVVLWSLGNEIFVSDFFAGDPTGATSAEDCRRMAALVRSLDGTRPISEGGDAHLEGRPESLDVGDVHYADTPTPAGIPPALVHGFAEARAAYPGKALVQSESFPPSLFEVWRKVEASDWLIGDFVWTAWDYIGEAGIGAPPLLPPPKGLGAGGGYPWYVSGCGDVDLIGQRKPQSYWRSVVWDSSPLEMAVERPAPPGTAQNGDSQALNWGYFDELRSWTWDVPLGQEMKVRVYTSGDAVELRLDGAEVAARALTEADQRRVTLPVPYAPGRLTAIAYRAGREVARQTLETTGPPARLRLTADTAALTTGRDDLAHALVEVLDAAGRAVPDAVVPVRFSVSGAGSLAGVANANPRNVDSFRRPGRYTYHGQALAILRPAKEPGSLTLTATASGLVGASLTLRVSAAPGGPQPTRRDVRLPRLAR